MLTIFKKVIPYIAIQKFSNENIIIVSVQDIKQTLMCLKKHIGYNFNILSYVAGVDFFGCRYRFSVVYDILSTTYNTRLRVKVLVNEITSIPSIVDIFINANWWEREIWDLYGVYFENHPDLRRILTDYGFEGYPFRKDFPLTGFLEVRYDETKKRVVLEPLELSQEFRVFTFETPW